MRYTRPKKKKESFLSKIGGAVSNLLQPAKERIQLTKNAITKGEWKPLGESFRKQASDMIPQRGEDPRTQLEKTINIVANTGTSKIGKLAKPKVNLSDLSRKAVNSLENVPKPKPGSYSRALSEVKAGIQMPVKIRTLPDGKVFIEDGRHRLHAAMRLGKDLPVEDVSKHYKPRPTPVRGNAGRFNGSTSNSEAGFAAFPAESIADAASGTRKQLRPAIGAIGAEGKAGRTLADKITRAADIGEVNAGKRINSIRQAPRMTKVERFNLTDVLEGRAEPLNDSVAKAAKIYRSTLDDVAKEATESGVKVRRKGIINKIEEARTAFQREQIAKRGYVRANIVEKFKPRENYYPHIIAKPDELASGALRKDIAAGLVNRGIRKTTQEAEAFIDEYIDYVRTGKQQDSLIDYMVSTGQAENTSEAFAKLQKYRTRTIKKGATEFSRDADLPFYDPDPERAVPQYLARESKRLPEIREFGQKMEIKNELIKQIRDSGGDYEFTSTAVDRILQIANESNSFAVKTGILLRTIQGFKLGLAGVSNMTQGVLNSWLKGDLRSVFAGLYGALTPSGKEFAVKSGATLDSVLDEAAKTTGALKFFLKATGFTATEKFNRRLAASAGRSYGTRLFPKALAGNKRAIAELKEFGVDVTGKTALTDDDVLMIAKKFTDITQFRSRPQDLPLFVSSEAGKTLFQFKNFIYGQTRFMARQTFGEFRRGNFGRGTRNLLLLGTVFPLAGEAVADIRAAISGKERDAEGLRRYFENLGQVGGLGILYDAIKSGGMGFGVEFFAGPTLSDAGSALNATGEAVMEGNTKNLGKFFTKRIPIVGSRVTESMFPSSSTKRTTRKRPVRRRRPR